MAAQVQSVVQNMYAEPRDDSDAVLKVGEYVFHVHSLILGVASSVFKKMFTPNFKEGKDYVVNLPGKSPQAVSELLMLIYPNAYTLNVSCSLRDLLEMTREYSMDWLHTLIDKYLENEVLENRQDMSHFILSEEFSLEKTKDAYVVYSIESWNALGTKQDWEKISLEVRYKILLRKGQSKSSKMITFCEKMPELP